MQQKTQAPIISALINLEDVNYRMVSFDLFRIGKSVFEEVSKMACDRKVLVTATLHFAMAYATYTSVSEKAKRHLAVENINLDIL